MIYLDTNVLLYATLSIVDTPSQQTLAIKILQDLIEKNSLILSNLTLLEYVFVMRKAKENEEKINSALEIFSNFVKEEKENFNKKLIQELNNNLSFKNSFDLYHLIFAKSYKCQKLITFDKGFKKFKELGIEIKVL